MAGLRDSPTPFQIGPKLPLIQPVFRSGVQRKRGAAEGCSGGAAEAVQRRGAGPVFAIPVPGYPGIPEAQGNTLVWGLAWSYSWQGASELGGRPGPGQSLHLEGQLCQCAVVNTLMIPCMSQDDVTAGVGKIQG
eukprot:2705864-Rhodomonas_salina.1